MSFVYSLLFVLFELITGDSLRQLYRTYVPICIIQWLIRTILTLPSPMARLAIYHFSKPLANQRDWIKLIENDHWKGAIIAANAMHDSEQMALNRLVNADLVIYEVHGGGFRVGHCVMYMDAFISWLTVLKENHGINAVIMSVEYGLAPEVYYPGPVVECVNAYQYLTSKLGVSPSKIIISGDSAGGIISLEMLCHVYAPELLVNPLAQRNNFDLDLPAGILLSSPVISVNQTSETWKKFAGSDLVSHKLFELVIKEYIKLTMNRLDHVAMFKIFNNLTQGGLEHICQGGILLFVGEKEVFSQDIYDFAHLIKQKPAKLRVDLCKAPFPHDWYLIRDIVDLQSMPMMKYYDDFMAKWCQQSLSMATNQRHLLPLSTD